MTSNQKNIRHVKKQKKNLSEQTDAEIKHMKELVDRNVKTVSINTLHMSRKVDEIGLDKKRHGIFFNLKKNKIKYLIIKKAAKHTFFWNTFQNRKYWGHKTSLDEHKSF